MIDFTLSEEQRKLLNSAREFSKNEIEPIELEYDIGGLYPEEVLKKAHELGFTYSTIPKEFGGSGMSYMDHLIVTEALNHGCAGIASFISISFLSMAPILLGATEEQKKRILTPVTKSHKSSCFALTEPEAGSDVSSLATTAIKKGDIYIINGLKRYITNGKHSDLITLFATVDKSLRSKGICCFAVPRSTPGITVTKEFNKLGQRALCNAEITFENVEVSEENLIGKEGDGFKLALRAIDYGRFNITAVATGIAQRALDEARNHANTRIQFGKTIGRNEAIQFMLADMNALIMASRLMYLQGGWMLDNGLEFNTAGALAKVFATDAAMKVTTDAVQILGGKGYMKDCVVEKLMRDAKLTQIYEGTNQINRMVAGRGILKKPEILF
ncbi:MAG: acyl-CoA dehydrogenase family protein [Promethearchaeota archaeon]